VACTEQLCHYHPRERHRAQRQHAKSHHPLATLLGIEKPGEQGWGGQQDKKGYAQMRQVEQQFKQPKESSCPQEH